MQNNFLRNCLRSIGPLEHVAFLPWKRNRIISIDRFVQMKVSGPCLQGFLAKSARPRMSLKAVQDLPQPKFSVEFFQRNFQLALFGSFARFGYDQCPNGYKDIKKELNRHKEKIT